MKLPYFLAAAEARGLRETRTHEREAPLAPQLKEACDHACAPTFACMAVNVRGRCEGFPSAWNEVLYSQWDATKRVDGEERVAVGGGGTKRGRDKG